MFFIGGVAKAIFVRWRGSPGDATSIVLLAASAPYFITVIDRGYLPAQAANVANVFVPLVLGTLYARRRVRMAALPTSEVRHVA
jgi:hypothetical protein